MNTSPKFKLGDPVRKTKGSQWSGTVVGTYSTELTPEGYAVESSSEKGSVQIYPAGALEGVNPVPVESLQEEVERLRKASVPICIGQPLIQILAAEGQWISMDGQSLIAADSLFKKDPYIELEKTHTEVRVLRQDNEHHVNRCYTAEKARNEALNEVERLNVENAGLEAVIGNQFDELSTLRSNVAAAKQLFIALDAVKAEMVNLGHVTERVQRLTDAALTAWQEANK